MHCALRRKFLLALLLVIPQPTFAEYLITGKFEGWFCKGFVLELCVFEKIDAAVKDGRLFELPNQFDQVDEYRNGTCSQKIKNSWYNWWIGDVPVFYQYLDGPRHEIGSYKNLGTPDFVTFECKKR